MSVTETKKKQLRQHLRQLRNSLNPAQQQQAADRLKQRVSREPIWQQSQNIAVYMANDGEVDLMPLVQLGWQQGKSIFLPVIDPARTRQLLFIPWRLDTVMTINRFGITEPAVQQNYSEHRPFAAQSLDLVLLPLTGFDDNGNRLGMGGGFYDYTFAFVKQPQADQQPFLAGIAHECQRVEMIPVTDKDIQLSAIYSDLRGYP